MLCTNGHNNADDAAVCRICGVNTFSAPALIVKASAEYSGMAIASMVLGIVWIYGIGSILALVFGYQARKQINRTGQRGTGMATASMVLGIVWIYGIGSILALVFGYQARKQINRTGQRGTGMATAGIVLGWVGLAGVIFIVFFVTAIFHSVHFVPCSPNCQP